MRSILLVIFSALLLAGGFLVYWTSQPKSNVAAKSRPTTAVEGPAKEVAGTTIRPGDAPYMRQFDTGGKLTSEFRGDHFNPRPNGTIDITNPVARFFLSGGQHLEVTGDTGNVVLKDMPNPGQAGLLNSGPMSAPSSGRLDHVIVKLIDEATNQPTLTMRTRNVVFDNETFRIATEGYRDEDGHDVAFDQVPVHVVGQESGQGHGPYLKQMEGRGLTVRWNDRDGRLELLEIAHGDFLVIDNANSSMLPGTTPKPTTAPASALSAPLSAMLASTDPQATSQVIPPAAARAAGPKPAPHPSHPTVVYRATFFDNVRINQPDPAGGFDQILIDNVNQMDVDFLLSNGSSSTTRPATAPAATTAPADSQPSAVAITSSPAPDTKPADVATSPTSAPAATQPAQASRILIHWTGRLLMTPLMTKPWAPLRPGEGAVKLIGLPVHMHRIDPSGGGFEDIRSATALYATAGDHVQLDHSRQFPTIFIDRIPPANVKDRRQTHLVSVGQVQYAREPETTARCVGSGYADVPMESQDPKSPPATMHATWTKLAEFSMTMPPGGTQMVLHEGHFAGAVDIQHPQMALRSELLDLYFDQHATRSPRGVPGMRQTLKQAVATTGVFCQFTGSDGKKQSIEGDRIVVDTGFKNNKSYASHVSAAGSVHAYTDDELRADNLDVTLKPAPEAAPAPKATTRKSDPDTAQVQLQEMVAWGNVTAKSKDGSIAIGDKLNVTADDAGKQHAVLVAAGGAKVINPKGNFVTGPEIQFDSADGRAYVIGAGRMEALQESKSATQPAEKITVNWATGALFDGQANRIDATGDVLAETIDGRGFHDIGKGDRVRVDLQQHRADDAATTQPAAQLASAVDPPTAAATAGATTAPAAAPDAGQMNLFKDKEVVAITLDGHARLTSTLPSADAGIAQQIVLDGPRIIDREISPEGLPERTVTVPSKGQMLVRDHRPTGTTQKSEGGDMRGAMLFLWQRSLVYSKATKRADMVGDVHIHYEPSTGDPTPALITGDHVIAYFDESPTTRPGTTAATKPASDDSSSMHLRLVSILAGDADDVSVTHGTDVMKARQVDFDPQKHLLTAIGTRQNPVFFFNGATMQTRADRAEWDTLTWNPHLQGGDINYHPHADTSAPKPKK